MSARQQVHKAFRGKSYYFRIAIPTKLQSVLGGREFKRSLKTANSRQATYLCRILSNGMEELFMMIEQAEPRQADYQKRMRGHFEKIMRKASDDYQDIRAMFYGSEPDEPTLDPYKFEEVAEQEYRLLKAQSQSYGYTPQRQEEAARILIQNEFGNPEMNSYSLAGNLMAAELEARRIEFSLSSAGLCCHCRPASPFA